MWSMYIFELFLVVVAARDSYDKIGYFWHITDMHYDSYYHSGTRKGCWKPEYEGSNSGSRSHRVPAGRFGDYSCDSSWDLIESAAHMMMSRRNENVEFVLWTGDTLSHVVKHLPEAKRLDLLQNLTDLLQKTFSSQFVFPALGHDDPGSRKKMSDMWSRWFPADSLKTFISGGYYIIERKTLKLQIVVLNTNLMKKSENDADAARQWDWLDTVLQKFHRNGETINPYQIAIRNVDHLPLLPVTISSGRRDVISPSVPQQKVGDKPQMKHFKHYANSGIAISLIMLHMLVMQHAEKIVYLVGHMAPGSDERQRPPFQSGHLQSFSDYHNRRYLKLVRRYADIIVGQFFGHLHSDTFRVIYNEHGRPASWAMLAPAVTPKRTAAGPNNPGLRLYKFNQNTGQILDYTQYYLDLTKANLENDAKWSVEYNFSTYYMINNITPLALHNLAEKLSFTQGDNPVFNRYYRANSVRIHNNQHNHSPCDATCAHTHYCAITRVDYEENEQCLKTAASALSTSSYWLTRTPHSYSTWLAILLVLNIR